MSKSSKRFFVYLFLVLSTGFLQTSIAKQESAEKLFSDYKDVLFQIQIIDSQSNQKSSIGSGFIIASSGLAVTNYHVVSDYIQHPDKNRIEVEDINGDITNATLVNFDVINDLALIKIELDEPPTRFLSLANNLPTQGSLIYSLGNPRDLGMVVVPGTYNGLKQNSFYEEIHFTGSVNPGMSGGPVVNEDGQVMGVNVATGGNQLGFLVPLNKVQALVDQAQGLEQNEYKSTIQQQLYANQKDLISQVLSEQWPHTQLGKAKVPDAMTDFITCWGGSNSDKEDAKYLQAGQSCSLDQTIYIGGDFRTGQLSLNFSYYTSDELNDFRFYSLIQSRTGFSHTDNGYAIEDFSEYHCQQDLVQNVNQITFKSALCLKAYKDYEGLYDAVFVSATTERKQESLVSRFVLSGVSQQSIQAFLPVFMDAISWQ